MRKKLNRAEKNALEKLFVMQINCDKIQIVQSKAKIWKRLEEKGYVEFITINLGGRLPVSVSGYQFTFHGHITYCCNC